MEKEESRLKAVKLFAIIFLLHLRSLSGGENEVKVLDAVISNPERYFVRISYVPHDTEKSQDPESVYSPDAFNFSFPALRWLRPIDGLAAIVKNSNLNRSEKIGAWNVGLRILNRNSLSVVFNIEMGPMRMRINDSIYDPDEDIYKWFAAFVLPPVQAVNKGEPINKL